MRIATISSCAGAALFAHVGPASSQETYQHDCHFNLAAKAGSDGLTQADVNWQVSAARKGEAARISVKESGTYRGRARAFSSGAVEFAFSTENSSETMTIGVDGEALWDIELSNGDRILYFGGCNPARRTN